MIRRAEASDATALAELMSQLGFATTSTEMSERLSVILNDQNFATFVAVEADKVCGMIGLSASPSYEHNDRTGRIVALAVDERRRRRGFGRALIANAEEYFLGRKIIRVVLNTRFERQGAHQFYKSLGYARTGLRFMKQLPTR